LLLFDFLSDLLLAYKINHGSRFVVFGVQVLSEILLGVLGSVVSETTESVTAIECPVGGFLERSETRLFEIRLLLGDWT
jgi:hypothetical protein